MRPQGLNSRRTAKKYEYFQAVRRSYREKFCIMNEPKNSCNIQRGKASFSIPPTFRFPLHLNKIVYFCSLFVLVSLIKQVRRHSCLFFYSLSITTTLRIHYRKSFI